MNPDKSDYRPSSLFRPLTGWHVLAGFVFFFGIVFAVNGFMAWRAVTTFDGVETAGAYQKGRAYNHLLDRMEAQRDLGWSAAMTTESLPGAAHRTRLGVAFADSEGRPLQDLDVEAVFWRPVAAGADSEAKLQETEPGQYEATFDLAHPGNWIVRVAAIAPGGETFVTENRVVLRD